MNTPFTKEQFFSIFEKYNISVFPLQVVIVLLGFGTMFLLYLRHQEIKSKLIGSYLGLLWVWTGSIYHIAFFSVINPAAIFFGIAFIVQGVLILYAVFRKEEIGFDFNGTIRSYFGYFFLLFGLILYPVIGFFFHGSFAGPIALGLPCPSTIFTFGFFLLAPERFPKYLLVIPSLWAIVGSTAAVNFGVYQDFMLPVSAFVADMYVLSKKRRPGVIGHA